MGGGGGGGGTKQTNRNTCTHHTYCEKFKAKLKTHKPYIKRKKYMYILSNITKNPNKIKMMVKNSKRLILSGRI